MTIPMNVRELAIACRNAADRIFAAKAVMDENEKRLAELGFPDVIEVLESIDEEERAKPPAPIPNQK
jgi:hypothetical protein